MSWPGLELADLEGGGQDVASHRGAEGFCGQGLRHAPHLLGLGQLVELASVPDVPAVCQSPQLLQDLLLGAIWVSPSHTPGILAVPLRPGVVGRYVCRGWARAHGRPRVRHESL